MRSMPRRALLLTSLALPLISTQTLAQTPGPPGGPNGRGPMHRGAWAFHDPASYLDALKSRLGITEAQSGAWKTYADTVISHANEMRAQHQSLFAAMDTATWEERRAMMNRMFEAHQAAHDKVREAAGTLLGDLTPRQRADAATVLPGLAPRGRHRGMGGMAGPGMMGR